MYEVMYKPCAVLEYFNNFLLHIIVVHMVWAQNTGARGHFVTRMYIQRNVRNNTNFLKREVNITGSVIKNDSIFPKDATYQSSAFFNHNIYFYNSKV